MFRRSGLEHTIWVRNGNMLIGKGSTARRRPDLKQDTIFFGQDRMTIGHIVGLAALDFKAKLSVLH